MIKKLRALVKFGRICSSASRAANESGAAMPPAEGGTVTGLIVHEWIERSGGAERVVDQMARAFPAADIHCLWNDDPGRFDGRPVSESWVARTPLRGRKAIACPVMPVAWRRLRLEREYDWLLVSSHLFAHHVDLAGSDSPMKYVYVHTPARYLWEPGLDARGSGPAARVLAPALRGIDRRRAQEPNKKFAANSEFVRKRMARTWGVDARVLYPPVETSRLRAALARAEESATPEPVSLPKTYILGASRFVPYKRLEDVILVGEFCDIPVVIAGSGPDERRLRSIASNASIPVYFVHSPTDELLAKLIANALVYVFPGIEDFGIMPVEAMALGTPPLVYHLGGASESVLDGSTGVHVHSFGDKAEVLNALEHAVTLQATQMTSRAEQFSDDVFVQELTHWVAEGAHGSFDTQQLRGRHTSVVGDSRRPS